MSDDSHVHLPFGQTKVRDAMPLDGCDITTSIYLYLYVSVICNYLPIIMMQFDKNQTYVVYFKVYIVTFKII
jgi:hypothetical protein